MKKIYRNLILVVCIFIILSPVAYAENNEDVDTKILSESMSKDQIMERYYELKDENQELRDEYNNLRQEWSNEKIDIANKKASVDNKVFKVVTIGGALLVIFSLSIFIYVKNHIKNKLEELYENKINRLIEDELNKKLPKEVEKKVGVEINNITKMIDERKKEDKFKEEKKILVISKNRQEQKELEDSALLDQFENNKMKTFEEVNENLDENLDAYEVIIFNDINGLFTDEEMNNIVDSRGDDNLVYFYFNKNRKRFESNKPDNTNFANSNSTFEGNLIDLMKYQDNILLKNQRNK